MSNRVTATFYVQIVPDRYGHGERLVHGARAMRITQGRPEITVPDSKVVKMRITLPVEAFENVPVVDVNLPLEALTEVEGSVAVA